MRVHVIDHDDGHIVIDTGTVHTLAERVPASRLSRRLTADTNRSGARPPSGGAGDRSPAGVDRGGAS